MASFARRILATTTLCALAAPALAQTPPQSSLAALVNQVDIPYGQFTLPNGLRVIVHTDRKAPVVGVAVWYHIGSKNEPKGKTGFAHLFEHMMFYGSENAPGAFFGRLEEIGATDWNGTTWFDRTNYFQTVPTGALDRMLFLESDRMGHLLGAVTQEKLDNQRGVVQNEKRMGENEPGGLVEYAELAALLPPGHPYAHATIGSMADLNAASLGDVKGWFRDHYGPNNAVLVLAGDIDLATARAKVARYFGDIPRGAETPRPNVPVPTLPAPVEKVMKDRVAQVRLTREWTAPGAIDQDSNTLDLALDIIGGLGSSRLYDQLVRKEAIAVAVDAGLQQQENLSFVEISARVKAGVDPALVNRRMDEIIAQFLKDGPTADEVRRAATAALSARVKGLEQVGGFGGKAVTLAEGAVYSNDPAEYKKDLATIAGATPASVAAVARKWLGRPVFKLTLEPGERSAADQALAGNDAAALDPAAAKSAPAAPQAAAKPTRTEPPVGQVTDLQFPAIERTTLSNGMKLVFAQRRTVPVVRVAVSFDAGSAADDKAKLGTQALVSSLLDEGTKTRSAAQIAEEQERLGTTIAASGSLDSTVVSMSALKSNLAPSLDLFADLVRNPAFAPADVERLRATQLARIASELTQPQAIAFRTLPPLLYGTGHPYGIPFTGSGTPEGVRALTRDDLLAFQARWLRPDNGTLFVVGDTTLAEIKPLLERRFGDWRASGQKGTKLFTSSLPTPRPRILLIDKPQSPQSMILAGEVTPARGLDNNVALNLANDVIGGSTTSRLITDLRETKGWAYYAGTLLQPAKEQLPFMVIAPVQSDKTGPAIVEARKDMAAWIGANGTTADEASRAIRSAVLSLPGSFETGPDLMGALMRIEDYRRPDDYYVTLPGRYRALTPAAIDTAARAAIDPAKLVWVVIGDAASVKPQLDSLGLPVEVVPSTPAAPAAAPNK